MSNLDIKAFISQIDRDDKITDLVNTMSSTYKFVQEGEPLRSVAEFKEHFGLMLKQTIECAYFIEAYAKSKFGMLAGTMSSIYNVSFSGLAERAIKASFTDVDKTIATYKENFEQLKADFQSSASLYTTISVRRVVEKIDDLSMYTRISSHE